MAQRGSNFEPNEPVRVYDTSGVYTDPITLSTFTVAYQA
ncbi:thiC-associated domain protein [Vibrio parahaemolyticus 10290]|nr:thiC-associated domain protein [Vibrio parahaemolyticus 10290]